MLAPHTIVSLRSLMEKFSASHLVPILTAMSQLSQVASTDQANREIPTDIKTQAKMALLHASTVCREVGLPESLAMIMRLDEQFKTPVKCAELQHTFHNLVMLMESEMEKRLFFVIDQHDSRFFDIAEPFGHEVRVAFPSACFDATEAGNCLALGRFPACVHCQFASNVVPPFARNVSPLGAVVCSRLIFPRKSGRG